MALVSTNSINITNYNAQPRVMTGSYLAGGSLTESVAVVPVGATDNIGSIYKFGFISSGARVKDILIQNDATGGAGSVFQAGVYLNAQQGLNLTTCVAPWSATVTYVTGNVVIFNGVVYTALAGSSGSQPPSGNWITGGSTTVPPGALPFASASQIFSSTISTGIAQSPWASTYKPSISNIGFATANLTLRVWELLGFFQDPTYEFHLCLTCTQAPSASGNIVLCWQWVR
jgi:hypothetical protein